MSSRQQRSHQGDYKKRRKKQVMKESKKERKKASKQETKKERKEVRLNNENRQFSCAQTRQNNY